MKFFADENWLIVSLDNWWFGICTGRNRQFGDQSNTADKDKRNDGMMNHSDKNAGESGRGRGSREDRWNDRKPSGRGPYCYC